MKLLVSVLLCVLISQEARAYSTPCQRKNQEVGYCMPIKECWSKSSRQANGLIDSGKLFFHSSQCESGANGIYLVCCIQPQEKSGRIINLLPQPPTCGGLLFRHRIFGGMEADLNEFPWLVLLEYRKWGESDLTTNCAGSLINHRYVLTAAHCLKEKYLRNIGKLVSVRLGEHDTSTDVDCSVGGGKCAKKFQRMGIENIVVHELYTRIHHNMYNDIGLIRLDQNVIYSESIQPICLPRAVGWEQRYSGQPLTVAGWGKTENKDRSPTKQKVVIGYVLFKECRRTYPWITHNQMCAGEHSEKDSCAGDSGGPLMNFRNGVGFLEGIVSFGYGCGIKDVPGVYTDVYAYDSWIRDNVRAGEGEYVDIIVDESVEDNNIYPLN